MLAPQTFGEGELQGELRCTSIIVHVLARIAKVCSWTAISDQASRSLPIESSGSPFPLRRALPRAQELMVPKSWSSTKPVTTVGERGRLTCGKRNPMKCTRVKAGPTHEGANNRLSGPSRARQLPWEKGHVTAKCEELELRERVNES